jgi:hypothetical protein
LHSAQEAARSCSRILQTQDLPPETRAEARFLRAAALHSMGDVAGALTDLDAVGRSDASVRIRADAYDSAANLRISRGELQAGEADRMQARALRAGLPVVKAATLPVREIKSREGANVRCRFRDVPELDLTNSEAQPPKYSYFVASAGPGRQNAELVIGGELKPGQPPFNFVQLTLRSDAHEIKPVIKARLSIDGREPELGSRITQGSVTGSNRTVLVKPDPVRTVGALRASNALQAVLYDAEGVQISAFTFNVSNFQRATQALSAVNFRCLD